MVMCGYYKFDKEIIESFDEQGFLKMGDVGYIDENGNLFIIDCIKELMKILGGKYIVLQVIEGVIGKDYFIEQIVVIVDMCKFVLVLIVFCFDLLEEYVKELNIKYYDCLEFIKYS